MAVRTEGLHERVGKDTSVKVVRERLSGVLTVELRSFVDERGFFVERFNERRFRDAGLPDAFCQDNHSRSAPRVLRGLHFQTGPPQGKLVGVIRGRIWDVVVDIRQGSATFGSHLATELNDTDGRLLWIPRVSRTASAFSATNRPTCSTRSTSPITIKQRAELLWDDPDLAIAWPVADPIVSERDRRLQTFAQYRQHPDF